MTVTTQNDFVELTNVGSSREIMESKLIQPA